MEVKDVASNENEMMEVEDNRHEIEKNGNKYECENQWTPEENENKMMEVEDNRHEIKEMSNEMSTFRFMFRKTWIWNIVRISRLFSRLRVVRKHDTDHYIDGLSCSECRGPLYQIM